jgi:tRNA (uracil-5-)-methyltransferase
MAKAARISGSYLVECDSEKYEHQFSEKQQNLANLLNWDGEIQAFPSQPQYFRFRANFQMWHDDTKNKTPSGFYYAMFDEIEGGKKGPREILDYPPGTEHLNYLMQQIQTKFTIPAIFEGLFEVRFLTTKYSPEESIIILCYKIPLTKQWETVTSTIAEELKCKIIGRSRKMMKIIGGSSNDEYVKEILTINNREYIYYQTEGAFSQPNAYVCEKMITWAMKVTQPLSSSSSNNEEDLLELYCGGGTFTAPLSTNFRQVLATEISKASVALAERCFLANQITNIKVIRLSSEEFTAWYENNGDYPQKRIQQAGLLKSNFHLTTVFVDPPRAGLDLATCQLLKKFPKIVYISCNPITLARDVSILRETHDVMEVAAFDQFPYTHHLESGVLLVKRPNSSEIILESVITKRTNDEITRTELDEQQVHQEENGDNEQLKGEGEEDKNKMKKAKLS